MADILRNPHTNGREWYHGTKASGEQLAQGFREPKYDAEAEGKTVVAHWNSLLGSHFAASHRAADKFAGTEAGGISDPRAWKEHNQTPSVVHARLHIHNPKTYRSEDDMVHEAYEHEHAAGNHIDNHLAADEEYWDHYSWGTQQFEGDSERKIPAHAEGYDWYGDEDDPDVARDDKHSLTRELWLNSHPDKEGIARRFKQRLIDQGHDGVIYGNAHTHERVRSDKPESNMAAIAFHPHQIEVTKHHLAGQEHHQAALMEHFTATPIGMASEYENDHPLVPEGEIHRGIPFQFSPEDHSYIHDSSQPVHERAQRVMGRLGGWLADDARYGNGGGLGRHWSTSERVARGFGTRYDTRNHSPHDFALDPESTRVVFHAAPPKPSHLITSPRTKMREDILPGSHGEREVPLRRRAPVTLTGISWGPNAKDAPMTRHDFPQPLRMKASATPGCHFCGEPLDQEDIDNESSAHEECEEMHSCPVHGEHDDPVTAENHRDTYTDWSEHLPMESIHRGLPRELPHEVHQAIHDPSRPMAERAGILRQHLEDNPFHGGLQRRPESMEEKWDPGRVGVHWTSSEPAARAWGSDDYTEGPVGTGPKPSVTHIVLHARGPEHDHIETDPDELDRRHMYGYGHQRSELEVPLKSGAPVHLTGISWKHGGQQDWNRHDYHQPIRMKAAAADRYVSPPRTPGETWSHLQEAHGVTAGGTRTPGADFMSGLHDRFHAGQVADRRSIPHQHESEGHPQEPGHSLSQFFTPIPAAELRRQHRAAEPKPERLDDREYSLGDVSRHYDWEGFDPHEISHLVHQPEHATFTKEDIPVKSLRHIDVNGRLVKPPSYQDIASQDEDEHERLQSLEHGYNQGAPIPPIVVVRSGRHHIIADGSHRAAVHAKNGATHIPAFVTRRTIFPEKHTAAALQLDTRDYEGTTGDSSHITRTERGHIPTSAIVQLQGVSGERPGEHRNRQGKKWDEFRQDIAENGIREPIFITVDYGDEPKISEGNHRRDAAVELGHSHVPVEIRYYGHAERQGTVAQRAMRRTGSMRDLSEDMHTDYVASHYWPSNIPKEEFRKAEKPYLDHFRGRIEREGIQNPIEIKHDHQGTRIWDGLHRLLVAEDLNLPSVPVVFHTPEGHMRPSDFRAQETMKRMKSHQASSWDTDWDAHYDQLRPEIHRALTFNLPPAIHRAVHNRSVPAEHRAKLLSDHLAGTPLGMHWTDDRDYAFRHVYNQVPRDQRVPATQVVVHAALPPRSEIETNRQRLKERGVLGLTHEGQEREIPLRSDTMLDVHGLSWRPELKSPSSSGNEDWEHHDFGQPMTHFASSDGDRFVTCSKGHEHWGAHGAAGLLIRHKGEDGQQRYLLQKRAPFVDHGSTWSVPGGAIGRHETPEQGAMREAREEIGSLPRDLKHHHTVKSTDCGNWAYHTCVYDSPEHFNPRGGGETDYETAGTAWHTHDEIEAMRRRGDLHPGFAKSWDMVRRSRGPRTAEYKPNHEYSAGRMRVSDIRRPGEGLLSDREYTQRELAADIKRNGVQQPLAIEDFPVHGGPTTFNGLHRLDAAERAGVHDVPVVVRHRKGHRPAMTESRPATEEEFQAAYDLERAGRWRGEHTAAARLWAGFTPVTAAAKPLQPLRVERGLYYRTHHKDAPFSRENASTQIIGESPGPHMDKYWKPQQGYSAFWHPAHLAQYHDEQGWSDDPETMKGRRVLAFRGTPVGKGADGEPRVMPDSDKPEESMSWKRFRDRESITPMPSSRTGHYSDFSWGQDAEGQRVDDGYRTIGHQAAAKKPTRTKAQVNYRKATGSKRCGNCTMITLKPPDFESHGCTLVKGLIEPDDTCDEWYPDKKHKTAAALPGALHDQAASEPNRAVYSLIRDKGAARHPDLAEPLPEHERTPALRKMLGRASFFLKPEEIGGAQAPGHAASTLDLAHHAARYMTDRRQALEDARPRESWESKPRPSELDSDHRVHGHDFVWHYALALDGAGHKGAADEARHDYAGSVVQVANHRHDQGLSRDFPGSGLSPHRPPDQSHLPPMPREQQEAMGSEDHRDYSRNMLNLAKNPVPGTKIWRGEQRGSDEHPGSPGSVGLHWTVRPESVITDALDKHEGKPVVWQARLSHPEHQAIPRSHPMWSGRHMSMDSEAEVRLHPGTSVHVEGAWVGEPGPGRGAVHPLHPEHNGPGWTWHPVGQEVPVKYRGHGATDYSEVGIPREAARSTETVSRLNMARQGASSVGSASLWGRFAPVTAAKKPYSGKSMMIAFVPPARVLDHLQKAAGPLGEDTEPRDQMHVTLLYLGEEGDHPKGHLAKLPDLVSQWGKTQQPFPARLQGTGTFINGDRHVLHGLVDVPRGHQIRSSLEDFLRGHGIGFPEEHNFTPHITIAYAGHRMRFLPKIEPHDWTVDRIYYCRGGKWQEVSLSAAKQACLTPDPV